MSYKQRQKSFRKIPAAIDANIGSSHSSTFRVQTVKRLASHEVQSGAFSHLGISFKDGQIVAAPPGCPAVETGKWARQNLEGRIVVRRDLPKTVKVVTFTVPLFGNYAHMCDITQYRDVYVRERQDGDRIQIEAEVLALENSGDSIVRFGCVDVLRESDQDFRRKLLFQLNLLRESTGDADLFDEGAGVTEFLGSIHVGWVLLPAGQRETNLLRIFSGFRKLTEEQKDRIEERYSFFESLNPRHLIRGTGSVDGYVGAEISDDLVVFEHMLTGNAVYIMFADWREQSQRTKTELLANGKEGLDFIRVTHTGSWQDRVRLEVTARRGQPKVN
jgi:hypothetical protein